MRHDRIPKDLPEGFAVALLWLLGLVFGVPGAAWLIATLQALCWSAAC